MTIEVRNNQVVDTGKVALVTNDPSGYKAYLVQGSYLCETKVFDSLPEAELYGSLWIDQFHLTSKQQ